MKPTTIINYMRREGRWEICINVDLGYKTVREAGIYRWQSENYYLWYQVWHYHYYNRLIDMPPLLEYSNVR